MTDIARLSVPLTLWLISFSGLYGLHGLVCSGHWTRLAGSGAEVAGQTALIAGFLAALLVQAVAVAVLWTQRFGGPPGFVRTTSLALALVALVATLWTLGPSVALPACAWPSATVAG